MTVPFSHLGMCFGKHDTLPTTNLNYHPPTMHSQAELGNGVCNARTNREICEWDAGIFTGFTWLIAFQTFKLVVKVTVVCPLSKATFCWMELEATKIPGEKTSWDLRISIVNRKLYCFLVKIGPTIANTLVEKTTKIANAFQVTTVGRMIILVRWFQVHLGLML